MKENTIQAHGVVQNECLFYLAEDTTQVEDTMHFAREVGDQLTGEWGHANSIEKHEADDELDEYLQLFRSKEL